jgi:hypothetical protein
MESEKLSYPPNPVETPADVSDDFKTPFQKALRKWLLGMLGLGLAICVWSVLLYFSKPDVVIATNAPNAQVFLDGQLAGTTNQVGKIKLPKVRTGKRVLLLVHKDFADLTKEIDVQSAFFPVTINAKLRPALFTLTVATTPPLAKVLLDDQEIGETDIAGELRIPEVRRGEHTLSVRRVGYEPHQETLEITEDRVVSIALGATLSGFWKGSSSAPNVPNGSYNFTLELKQTGAVVVGSWEELPALAVGAAPQSPKPKIYTVEGSVNGKQITLTRKDEKGQTTAYEAQLGDEAKDLTGNWKSARGAGAWFATRSDLKPTLAPPTLQPPPASSAFGGPGPTLTSPSSPPIDPGGGLTTDLLREAQQLYEQREYQAALRQCDVILKTDPKNAAARALRIKIQKTLEILNQ